MLSVLTALVLVGLPASAQDDAGLDVAVQVGLGGFVSGDGANPLSLTISADSLVSGSARLTIDGAVVAIPIEVPAGSVKTYEFEVPPIVGSGATRLQIVDDSGEVRWNERFNLRVPRDELTVGVFGDDGQAAELDGRGAVPFALDIQAFPVAAADLLRPLAPLDYLILLDAPQPESAEAILAWATGGGRVITTPAVAAEVGWAALYAAGATTPISKGAVTVASATTADDLVPLIRSIPPQSIGTTSGGFEDRASSLFEAASFGGSRRTATLGWLVGALVAYVLVAGPVNFLILRRLGKRDWAWVTIPAIGLMAMGVFWIVGRQSSPDRQVHHASVFLQSEDAARVESGVMLVATTEGEHRLSFPAGSFARPWDASRWWGMGSGTETEIRVGEQGATEIAYSLASFGVAAAQATTEAAPLDVSVTIDEVAVTVTNNSEFEFVDWGVRLDDRVFIGGEPILPASANDGRGRWVRANAWEGGTIGDTILQNQPWNEERQQRIWPLSFAATSFDRDLLNSSDYFFGFTDDLTVAVRADGVDLAASGAALVVVELPRAAAVGEATAASAELVRAVNPDWIEQYGPTYVFGADEVGVRFQIDPDAIGPLTLTNTALGNINGLEAIQVYNWTTGEFDPIELTTAFDSAGRVSDAGEVMVNFVFGGFDTQVMIPGLELSWGSS